jgi:uncharacterized repeat protein (TIGR02543 family)
MTALFPPVAPDIKYNIISNFSYYPTGAGIENSGGDPTINYNCFYQNNADCINCYMGDYDIDQNPQYAFASGGDYHLEFESVCIDAIPANSGDPVSIDWEGNDRPIDIGGIYHGGEYDMGAFEKEEDPDRDGLAYSQETSLGTDPEDAHSDADIYHDGEEVAKGSNPNDYLSVPAYSSGTYYVDADNEMIGLGTQASPWQTLHHAVDVINNGATGPYTLYVDEGVYSLPPYGHEPDEELYVFQSNLRIVGGGVGRTILDGAGGMIGGDFAWKDALDVQEATAVTVQNMTIRNFIANGLHLGSAVDCVIDACRIHDNANTGVTIAYGGGDPPARSLNNSIQNGCDIYNNGFAGVYINGGIGNQVINNTGSIHDNGNSDVAGAGLWIEGEGASNNLVGNNRIFCSGGPGLIQGAGIKISGGGTGNRISGNVISGHGDKTAAPPTGTGIEADGSDVLIEKNILYDNVTGIGVLDSMGHASPQIVNNLIYDGPENNLLWGICSEPVTGGAGTSLLIYHNTIDGGANDGIYLDSANGTVNAQIRFNIVSNFSHWGIADITGAANPSMDYNDVWNNGANPATDNYMNCLPGPNDISQDPDYIGGPGRNYHLRVSPPSPCMDAIPASAFSPHPVNDDLEETSRPQPSGGRYDMGCYEHRAATYIVTFIAGPGGSISGDLSQRIASGRACSQVTAVPLVGYEFVNWSGGFSGDINPLALANIRSNLTVYANFRQKETATHTVTFTAGLGGGLSGNPFQTIIKGGDCTPVKAVPDTGYEFEGWTGSQSSAANPLAVSNVNADMTFQATFKKKTYTVNSSADTGGKVSGLPTEPVPHGGTVTLTAVPQEGYEFAGWSGDYTGKDNPLVLASVASNLNIAAHFKIKTYEVKFTAGAGGRIMGKPSQSVSHGQSSSPVTAKPEEGYEFTGWSGGYTGKDNPLILSPVTSDVSVLANFEEVSENFSPQKPVLESPENNAVIPPGPVELFSGGYSDPEGDVHVETWWQVGVNDDPGLIINEKSNMDLNSYLVSAGFEKGHRYTWRTAFLDSGSGRYSPWSDRRSFLVGLSEVDENIPPVEPGISFKDYKMVSFIHLPEDPSAKAAFSLLLGDGYDDRKFRIGTYDPVLGPGGYREYPDFSVEPGRSYWFLAREGLDLTLYGVPVSTSEDICVRLKFNRSNANGWNMIAPPNDADYHWGDLQVAGRDSSGSIVFGPMPISQLTADNEYLDIRIWSWSDGSYEAVSDPGFLLMRYNGYWVRAKKANVDLCFPANAQLAKISPQVRIASWAARAASRFKEIAINLGAAYAGISMDTPPLPMEDLGGNASAGSGGCFISIITGKK